MRRYLRRIGFGRSFAASAFCLAIFALSTGCSLRSGSRAVHAAPPPPPPPAAAPAAAETPAKPEVPVSVPQTDVQLPAAQPVSPDALATIPAPPQTEQEEPAEPEKTPRRAPAPPVRKPESVVAETPPNPPVEEARPRIQPIVPSTQIHRLQEEIESRKRTVKELVSHVPRNPSAAEKAVVERIQSFLLLSDQAAKRGDMAQASALSERALVLARELQNVK